MEQDVHILVVEDDEDINQLLCQIIEDAGYTPQRTLMRNCDDTTG